MNEDIIALLKAHDPEPAATQAPSIESLLARLDAAAGAPRDSLSPSRAPRRLVAAALATAAAVVVAALTIGIGGERAGVVEEARAAVAADGAIVYTVTRTTFHNPDGSLVPAQMQGGRQQSLGIIGSIERWSAESPERWRSVMHVLPYRGSRGGTSTSAYADGVVRTRLSWEERIRTFRVPIRLRPPVGAPTGAALLAGVDDPLQTVRMMLDEGEVRRGGETTRAGGRILRLVADAPARPHIASERTVYLIDAETYAPVEVERRSFRRDHGHLRPAGPIVRIRFERYERLPMTPENEQLLRLGGN
jgi:hypothetical protein